jgi:hypothetical protein
MNQWIIHQRWRCVNKCKILLSLLQLTHHDLSELFFPMANPERNKFSSNTTWMLQGRWREWIRMCVRAALTDHKQSATGLWLTRACQTRITSCSLSDEEDGLVDLSFTGLSVIHILLQKNGEYIQSVTQKCSLDEHNSHINRDRIIVFCN